MTHHYYNSFILCVLAYCAIFLGCKADVDLSHINSTASLKTSIALPLGTIHAQLGDFIGNDNIEGLYIDEDSIYHYSHNMSFNQSISVYDFLNDIQPLTSRLDVNEEMRRIFPGQANSLSFTIPAGEKFTMNFPIKMSLEGLKNEIEHYRIDSISLRNATFTARTTFENFDLAWEDIKSMRITINKAFYHANGNTIHIPLNGHKLGEKVPFQIEDFQVIFMKDPYISPSLENHLDEIILNVHFDIETSHEIKVNSNQRIIYELGIDTFQYNAIYGYINEPTLWQDSLINYPITELWSDWSKLANMVLPLRKPSIRLFIEHALLLPMSIRLKELSVASNHGEQRYATFNNNRQTDIKIPPTIDITSPYNTTTIDSIILDYTEKNGNIDELFTIHPDNFTYNLNLGVDTANAQKQFRVTENTNLHMDLSIDIPIEFNENVQLSLRDTLRNIDLTSLQLDSLLSEVELINELQEVHLQLFLAIQNSIPFNISGTFTFFDEHNEIVKLSSMKNDILQLSIDCPDNVNKTTGVIIAPKETIITLDIHREDFEKLASVKYIIFNAKLGENKYPVALMPNYKLSIHAGVDTDICAIIDLNKLFNNTEL